MIKQPAYVLHSRPYRETSAMVDLFTPDYGLVRCIARGVKKSMSQGQALQPFIEYQVFFHGDSGLKNLDKYESQGLPLALKGDALFSGFYVNEVILRALRTDAEVEAEFLYEAYEAALHNLQNQQLELALRTFEITLLEHMGQSYEWDMDFKTADYVEDDSHYGFFVEQGMSRVSHIYAAKNPNNCFYGQDLKRLAQGDISAASTLKMCKRLLRLALKPIIGYKPIQARELLKQYKHL
ncbi:DNA repair protein RecO [Bermanella sp. WJH001]|uniref:DNA repair protein RecO n=1 Tax=Bermanella sp. WJH001 TaxID=3048005 RepID=UPI0024BEDD1A|nr:DNA repair protein RecO [Bermanella sp. WJH001]MDJ1537483.1 DNA repair protein RecO [Bermanella sp. WJH001]